LKALVLDGSRKGDNTPSGVSDLISHSLWERGYELDVVPLHDIQIADCIGCFLCWIKTPGVCVIDDAGRDIALKLIQSDLVVFLTPVVFGGYSVELKKALDRQIGNVLPFFVKIGNEVHHKARYERHPRLVGVGVLPHPDEESEKLFEVLVSRNAINMHSPAHSAGVVYTGDSAEKARNKIEALFIKTGAEK